MYNTIQIVEQLNLFFNIYSVHLLFVTEIILRFHNIPGLHCRCIKLHSLAPLQNQFEGAFQQIFLCFKVGSSFSKQQQHYYTIQKVLPMAIYAEIYMVTELWNFCLSIIQILLLHRLYFCWKLKTQKATLLKK